MEARVSVSLSHLADCPEHAETLARWHHDEWHALEPGSSAASRARELRLARRDGIPMTIVACEGGIVLGSASLIACDMDTHPELGPWLASVYVDRPRRGRGVGTTLIRRIIDEATALGFASLYLFTPHHAQLYAGLGWSRLQDEIYNGTAVTLMRLSLR
jgi:predicted N-acetyltransferase YhbS